MMAFTETGESVESPLREHAEAVVVIPECALLNQFFNEALPPFVSPPEIDWNTVITEIDSLRLRQFRDARSLFYAQRAAVPKTDAIYPFHNDADSFIACIEALSAVAGTEVPELTLRSDPALIYSWCVAACLRFGNEMRNERSECEAPAKRPRLSKEVGSEALGLLTRLNALLA